jgi:hypothetical protein
MGRDSHLAPLGKDPLRDTIWPQSTGPPASNQIEVLCSNHLVCGSSPFRHEASTRRDFVRDTKLAGYAIGGDR